jgi:hypothetical protein
MRWGSSGCYWPAFERAGSSAPDAARLARVGCGTTFGAMKHAAATLVAMVGLGCAAVLVRCSSDDPPTSARCDDWRAVARASVDVMPRTRPGVSAPTRRIASSWTTGSTVLRTAATRRRSRELPCRRWRPASTRSTSASAGPSSSEAAPARRSRPVILLTAFRRRAARTVSARSSGSQASRARVGLLRRHGVLASRTARPSPAISLAVRASWSGARVWHRCTLRIAH